MENLLDDSDDLSNVLCTDSLYIEMYFCSGPSRWLVHHVYHSHMHAMVMSPMLNFPVVQNRVQNNVTVWVERDGGLLQTDERSCTNMSLQ